jgi:hypothetical protein
MGHYLFHWASYQFEVALAFEMELEEQLSLRLGWSQL